MNNDKEQQGKSWLDFFRFRKQSIIGKIFLILSVFIFGSFLVYALLTISMNRWDDLGIISVWVLFGWIFFVILFYISFKLISLLMHVQKSDKQKSMNNEISQTSSSSVEESDHYDDKSQT